MYSVQKIMISETKQKALYAYLQNYEILTKNLYNAALFRLRQNFTMRGKEHVTENEHGVACEIEETLNACPFLKRPGAVLTYHFLERLMRVCGNPDFFAGLPMQSAQAVVKLAVTNFRSWLAALADYKKHPEKYTGKPRMPKYKRDFIGFTITNQDARLYVDGEQYNLKLPKFPAYYRIHLLEAPDTLRSVQISRIHSHYCIGLVFIREEEEATKGVTGGTNLAAIDFGVDNLAALVSTNRLCVLYKGGIVKSKNQWLNKEKARLTSAITKGHKGMRASSRRLSNLSRNRTFFLMDYFHKVSSDIIRRCLQDDVGVLILGSNKEWKQSVNLGSANNQTFISIPLGTLKNMLKYKGRRAGIRVIEQEESYTSKADYLIGDPIPVYGKEEGMPVFSGARIKRGLYRSGTGRVLNADINAAANILRKAMPDAGTCRYETLASPCVMYKM